jgi:hypothetical protein
MKKQKTFESRYVSVEQDAIEWLLHLAKCFPIKKVTLKTYTKNRTYLKLYCCKVVVEYG